MLTVFLFVFAPLFTGNAHAESLTLTAALDEAHSHSPALKRAQAAADGAHWKVLEAASDNLPKFSASANHIFDLKYQQITVTTLGPAPVRFPAIYPYTQASLDVRWTVFDGMRTPFHYVAALHQRDAADLELSRARLQTDNEITLRFYQALAAQQLADVAVQNLKTLREHLDKTEERLRQGKVTRFDLLRVQVQLDEAEPEKLAADDNVIITRRALAQAMGIDEDARPLEGALPEPAAPVGIEAMKLEPGQRDDLQAVLHRTEAAHRNHAADFGLWMPSVTLAASKQYYNNLDRGLNNGQFADAYSVGVFLNWNIFDGGLALARQLESHHEREIAEANARAAQLKAPDDFEIWRRRLVYNVSLYRARVRAIESAEESVRLARLSYSAGTRTGTDVLDAELDLFRARAGAVKARLDTADAKLNLELALGHKI